MNKIWLIDFSVEQWRLVKFGKSRKSRTKSYCDFVNTWEVGQALYYGGRIRNRPFPVAQLALTLEGFDLDYVGCEGRQLVSERMRDAMALGPEEVRYFDVDSSRSTPLAQSKNYQVMEAKRVAYVSDIDKSEYRIMPTLDKGLVPSPGELRYMNGDLQERQPLRSGGVPHARSIAIRMDANPKYDLFYDDFFRYYPMCTEALAMRVLRAGCTGVNFVDPSTMPPGLRQRRRTLRGIEELVSTDFENKTEQTRLVQAID